MRLPKIVVLLALVLSVVAALTSPVAASTTTSTEVGIITVPGASVGSPGCGASFEEATIGGRNGLIYVKNFQSDFSDCTP